MDNSKSKFDSKKYTSFRSDLWGKRDDDETSSHWLRGSIFDRSRSIFGDNSKFSANKPSYDYVALSQFQTAIANFVRIMTNDNSIQVKYRTDSSGGAKENATSKIVTLSAKLDNDGFDASVGMALHEASHILHTNFSQIGTERGRMTRLLKPDDYKCWNVIASFIEDAYVDAKTYEVAPGYRGYYSALYQKYFGTDEIVEGLNSIQHAIPTRENYMFHVINSRNPHSNPNMLPNLDEILKLLDLENIDRLKTQADRLKLAELVSYKISEAVQQFQKQSNSNGGDKDEDGDGDNQNQSNNSSGSKSKSSRGKSSGNQSGQGDQDDTDDGDQDDQDESDDEQDSDQDTKSKSGKSKSKSGKSPKGGSQNDDGDEDDSDDDSDEAQPKDRSAMAEQMLKKLKQFYKNNGTDPEDMPDFDDMDDMSGKDQQSLEAQIRQQQELILGDAEHGKGIIDDQTQAVVDAYTQANVDTEDVAYDASGIYKNPSYIKVTIIRNITMDFIETIGGQYGMRNTSSSLGYGSSNASTIRKRVSEGIRLGKSFAKKIQVRNEERTLTTNRLNSGKLDKRLLHEIGFDNYAVFSKTNIHTYKPSFIHISLDQSGSMGGENWFNAIQFAAMIATASKYINNLDVMISVRSSTADSGKNGNAPYLAYIFDSRVDTMHKIETIFPCIFAHNSTPEGLTIAAITAETIKHARNMDAYFINLCDGEPAYSFGYSFSYSGIGAQRHSGEQMKKMMGHGINCMTYYIGDDAHTFRNVESCYGKHTKQIRSANETRIIADSINELLLKDS